jgi:dethiobiotin synthase
MKGIFVIGTDTGVGKTFVCAGLLKMFQGEKKAAYWKPVQTGVIQGDDTAEVNMLTGLDSSSFIEPAYRFPEVLSPYAAAKKRGKKIELEGLNSALQNKVKEGQFVVVEGAGGVLVPYDISWAQLDLIKASGFPVLIVGKDKVGVINQALLSIQALQKESIPVLGVVLTHSTGTRSNAEVIEEFSEVKVLLEVTAKEDQRLMVAEVERSDSLRKTLGVKKATV